MLNFKVLYDSVVAAEAAYKEKAAEIHALTEVGTEEAIENALALQGSLDTLQANYEKLANLYEKVTKANQPNDLSKFFVPASSTSTNADEAKKDVMKRGEFSKLSTTEARKFLYGGGKVED